MNSFKKLALSGLAALVMGIGAAKGLEARTLRVPSEYATIESAMNASVDNDTVLVASGTYRESTFQLPSKAITLKSESGPENTLLEALVPVYNTVVYSVSEVPQLIEGFTIRGGRIGIECGNRQVALPSYITIKNNIIKANDHGIMTVYGGDITITNNVIENNTSHGINIQGGGAHISYNLIRDNSEVGILGNNSTDITNNTIVRNGLLSTRSATPGIYGGQFYNNIIAFNLNGVEDGSSNDCNDVFGNVNQDYIRTSPGPRSISQDPLFCDPSNNNYLLNSDSSCLPGNNQCGLIGALGLGCGPTEAKKISWGGLKAVYR